MKSAIARPLFAAAIGVGTVLLGVGPGSAQSTKQTTIAYEAIADTTGVRITLAPGGNVAQELSGGITSGKVTATPSASGSAEAQKGNANTTAKSEAPPDKQASHKDSVPLQGVGVPNLLVLDGGVGAADSMSEADDGTPTTESSAAFGAATVAAGNQQVLQASLQIGAVATASSAKAKGVDVVSQATSDGVLVKLTVQAGVLQAVQQQTGTLQQQLCGGLSGLPAIGPTVGTTCNTLFQTTQDLTAPVEFLSIAISDAAATCSWDGQEPAAEGKAAVVSVSVLGQALPAVGSAGAPTVIAQGTPLESTIAAGTLEKLASPASEGEEDAASVTATGPYLELLTKQVQIRFSQSSCSLKGKVTTDEVIAKTGGQILPYLAGGMGLIAAASGIRRFLRRR